MKLRKVIKETLRFREEVQSDLMVCAREQGRPVLSLAGSTPTPPTSLPSSCSPCRCLDACLPLLKGKKGIED